jgi:hypothetical protein
VHSRPVDAELPGWHASPLLLTVGMGRLLSPAMLKLRRLRVERFRSLARGAELSFSDGINVLLGQNGTARRRYLS